MSVSDEFLRVYVETYQTASLVGEALVVGGKALREEVRSGMRYAAFFDTLAGWMGWAVH